MTSIAATAETKQSRTARKAALFAMAHNVGIGNLSMLRRQTRDRPVRPELCSHAALGAMTPPDLHDLPRTELGKAEPAQRLHVDEDIRSPPPRVSGSRTRGRG